MKVRCPHCQKTISLANVEAGQAIQCSCGKKLRVPASVGSATQKTDSRKPAQPTAQRTSTVVCDCGKRLRVPEKAFGKQVRCQCGVILAIAQNGARQQQDDELFPIETLTPQTPEPSVSSATAPDEDWLSDLPDVAAAPPISYSPAQYNASRPSSSGPSPSKSSAKSNAAGAYLAAAETERQKEAAQAHTPVDWSINGGLLGGVAMMIGAVVWFVAGLAAGYIYFYPPILLISGAVTVIRSIGD